MQRDNISMIDAEKIISCQMAQSERLKYADFIIDNSSNIDDLKKEVKRVYDLISEINYGEKHSFTTWLFYTIKLYYYNE